MNFQQLEYIVAIEDYKNFALAAEKCFVTQPTLSMMVQKLEDELNVKIFDRTKHPVVATYVGESVIAQARNILSQAKQMKQSIKDFKGSLEGEVRVGIIPTIAPYLLPMFLKKISKDYPKLILIIEELTTDEIIEKLNRSKIDIGILATPLRYKEIKEFPVYYEKFYAYASNDIIGSWKKKYLMPDDIKVDDLLLLEEGHCLRNQVINLCGLKKANSEFSNAKFEAGSIETLINLVDEGYGITLIPELAVKYFNSERKKRLKEFKSPEPVREISIVTNANFERVALVNALVKSLQEATKKYITAKKGNVQDVIID